MIKVIRIKRQSGKDAQPYWQEFAYDGDGNVTVAAALNTVNARIPLTDITGKETDVISWECGCMIRKCGACAMRIDGIPRLACSTFLSSIKKKVITLEPLSKFPVVKDLIVDRSVIFNSMKKMAVWLKSEAYLTNYTHEQRYQSSRCLMCGCCLEVCPNFSISNDFAGAVAPVNVYRILNEEQDSEHRKEVMEQYQKVYFDGCGKSMSCHSICPAGIPVEGLMVHSNAVAVWKR